MNCKFLLSFILMAPCSLVYASDIDINPSFTGRVIETDSKIIVEGGTIIMNADTSSAIKLNKGSHKEVVISNVRVLSNNQNLQDSRGMAGVIVIDNSSSTARVTVRNIGIASRNATVSSQSQGGSACAGVVCIDAGIHDTVGSVAVMATGQTNISATQGARPDYRKIK
ncbi:MAG: hypothetical protein JZU64_01145 [Rhodoferax sp.]|nr:hypothetical protein [Rhodoferax sp.]